MLPAPNDIFLEAAVDTDVNDGIEAAEDANPNAKVKLAGEEDTDPKIVE